MLISKLWHFPHVWIKKRDVFDAGSEMKEICREIFWDKLAVNSDIVSTLLSTRRIEWIGKIYPEHIYQLRSIMKAFWDCEKVVVILNDQIWDSILSVPLLSSLASIWKKIIVYWKNHWLIRKVSGMDGALLSNSDFIFFDYKKDNIIPQADEFCINLHRYYEVQGSPNGYMSLDWRMLPVFWPEDYCFPNRLKTFIEVVLWFSSVDSISHSSKRDLSGGTTDKVLIVPFSSIPEKELSVDQWWEIAKYMIEVRGSMDLILLGNLPIDEFKESKFYWITKLITQFGANVRTFCGELEDVYDFLARESPYVISVDTWIAHLTSIIGLKTNIIYFMGNHDFWSFGLNNVRKIPSVLARYLRNTDYGLFDPVWWNTTLDQEFLPMLELNSISTRTITSFLL